MEAELKETNQITVTLTMSDAEAKALLVLASLVRWKQDHPVGAVCESLFNSLSDEGFALSMGECALSPTLVGPYNFITVG